MNGATVARQGALTEAHDTTLSRNLRDLLAGTGVVAPDLAVVDLTLDSRAVQPGAAFVALPGLRSHGISFAAQAVQAGASAILWEPVEGVAAPQLPKQVALIAVPKLRESLGVIADRFFGEPSAAVNVTGITGTNGKTTTAYVLASALADLGRTAAYAGTLGVGRVAASGTGIRAGTHTTPDCVSVHRQIAELRDAGVSHLGMEVSSHALDQGRVAGVRFDTAVFTNLTHDHLDYHGTVEAYGAAKARLFAWPGLKHAVINGEDAFGRELAQGYAGAGLVVYGRSPSLPASVARHLFASGVRAGAHGLEIAVGGSWGEATLRSRFVGDFNVDNLLCVLGVLLGWGVPLQRAIQALENCVAPPGRMETFTAPGRPLGIVDYAHTPDALDKALQAARGHCSGKLVCVFGCGGDRDARKRPVMGAIAERLADVVIVTDDNPRTEDGDTIVADIMQGLIKDPRRPGTVLVERDRAKAIAKAIGITGAGDVVLVAGKGHEDYQIVGLERRHFSDREVVLAELRRGQSANEEGSQ